ncbi:hypothetical protein FrEUN1fDRAFT_7586, partial [Parafrankia sp. EUN1f]
AGGRGGRWAAATGGGLLVPVVGRAGQAPDVDLRARRVARAHRSR